MNKSETINKLVTALVEAQKNIGPAIKDSKNPFFKSKYADLCSVMSVCKDPLTNAGLAVLQLVTTTPEGKHAVQTVLTHVSGEFISTTMTLEVNKSNMQELGSSISYAKRYCLQSMLFIPTQDDDAEATMDRKEVKSNVSPIVTKQQTYKPKSTENTTNVDKVVVQPVVEEVEEEELEGWV